MKVQKRLAASVTKSSPKRIHFLADKLAEIKEAITKHDIKLLLGKKIIVRRQKTGVSRARANTILSQKRKGRRKGHGSRKGKENARQNSKDSWIIRIRKQRAFIKKLYAKEILDTATYRDLYRKSKGGYFRSERHIKLYLEEKGILKQ